MASWEMEHIVKVTAILVWMFFQCEQYNDTLSNNININNNNVIAMLRRRINYIGRWNETRNKPEHNDFIFLTVCEKSPHNIMSLPLSVDIHARI